MLQTVHKISGEKPQIGRVFQFTGSNSVGIFFTVIDHPDGDVPLAGMVIANASGQNQIEAAMVYDLASRFGQSVNPMLQQLSTVWRPAVNAAAAGSSRSNNAVVVPPMHQASLPDGTASLSLPAGWNIVSSQSALGQMTVSGPQGELLGLNYGYNAEDPNNTSVQNMLRRGIRFQQMVYYPSNANLTTSFTDLFQQIRAAMRQGPAPIKVDDVQAPPSAQGQCVVATGQINPDGAGMRQMEMLLCRSTPNQNGMYVLSLTKCFLPLGATDEQRATANAIMGSYRADMQRAQAIANAQAAPIVAQMHDIYRAHQDALMSFTQQQIGIIQQIGANSTAFYNQSSGLHSRQSQEFSNYILDQSVVQNNFTGAHSTQWNSVANALVQSNPNKYSFVSAPNYIPGPDF
jgi:hypothetical protein